MSDYGTFILFFDCKRGKVFGEFAARRLALGLQVLLVSDPKNGVQAP